MEHASLPLFVRDAHSLWLETLAELGVVGLLLLVIAIGAGFVAAIARMGRLGQDRPLVAAMAGVLAAFVRGGRHRLDVGAEHRRPGRDRGAGDPGGARDAPRSPASRQSAVAHVGSRQAAARSGAADRGRRCCAGGDRVCCRADAGSEPARGEPGRGGSRRRRGGDRGCRRRTFACSPGRPRHTSSSRCSRSRRAISARRTATSRMRSSATAPTGAPGSWRRACRPRLVSYAGGAGACDRPSA